MLSSACRKNNRALNSIERSAGAKVGDYDAAIFLNALRAEIKKRRDHSVAVRLWSDTQRDPAQIRRRVIRGSSTRVPSVADSAFSSDHPATTETYTLSLHDALPILVKDFLKVRCRLALLPFLISCLIWLDLVASLPLIKERILVIILLLHFLSLMLGSVLVLMLPLLVWLTPDLRIKKSLLKCNWT